MGRSGIRTIGVIAALLLLAAPTGAKAAGQPAWAEAPVVPRINGMVKEKLRGTVAKGRKLGMRSSVFAKAGDSNTEMSFALYGLGCSTPKYGRNTGLRAVVRKYNRVRLSNPAGFADCQPGNSFSRRSAAAKSSAWSFWASTIGRDLPAGYWQPPRYCRPDESPITCELRAIRPRYLFILGGTNDFRVDFYFGETLGSQIKARLLPAIRQARAMGVVPILSTIPPCRASDPSEIEEVNAGVLKTNAGIVQLGRERKVPVINLWRALTEPQMIDQGMAVDGVHLGVAGAGDLAPGLDPGPFVFRDSTDFTGPALRYGANRRNLIWLKTLARLDRAAA